MVCASTAPGTHAADSWNLYTLPPVMARDDRHGDDLNSNGSLSNLDSHVMRIFRRHRRPHSLRTFQKRMHSSLAGVCSAPIKVRPIFVTCRWTQRRSARANTPGSAGGNREALDTDELSATKEWRREQRFRGITKRISAETRPERTGSPRWGGHTIQASTSPGRHARASHSDRRC
jgi:hypothetical protein